MLLAATSFWVVGMTTCYGLAFPAGFGVTGIWIGFTVALIVYASLLIWRFDTLSRRGFMPEVAHAAA